MLTRASGLVLAGGQSQRMGRNKAALSFDGTPLVLRVARRLAQICHPVYLVARAPETYRDFELPVIVDAMPGYGPVGGLHAGLTAISTAYAVAVACDLPFLHVGLLSHLIERAEGQDAVVPMVAGRPQPVHAVYHRRVAQAAEAMLQGGGGPLWQLLNDPHLAVLYIEEDELRRWDPLLLSFFNINTPEQYTYALELARTHTGEN